LHQGRSRRSPWFFIGLEWPFASSRLTTFATLRRQRRFHARPIRIKKGGVSFPTQTLSSSSFFGQDSLNSFLLGFRNSGSHQSPPAADQPLAEPSSGLRQSEISKRELFPPLAVYLPQKTVGTIPRPRFADSGIHWLLPFRYQPRSGSRRECTIQSNLPRVVYVFKG